MPPTPVGNRKVWAAWERSRKHSIAWLDGLIDTKTPIQILFWLPQNGGIAGREAIAMLEEEGIRVGLVKVKTLRPWPGEEIREATKNAKHIIIPEFNVAGWLAREVRASIPHNERVHAGPHVAGGMTMPPEIIASEIKILLGMKTETLASRGS